MNPDEQNSTGNPAIPPNLPTGETHEPLPDDLPIEGPVNSGPAVVPPAPAPTPAPSAAPESPLEVPFPTDAPPPKPTGVSMKSAMTILGVVAGVVVLGGGGFLYWSTNTTPHPNNLAVNTDNSSLGAAAGLGSELYFKAANPLDGVIPDNSVELASPLEDAYTNPFSQ